MFVDFAEFLNTFVTGTTQNTFSQSLLQMDSLAKNAVVLNKSHLRAAKDHFEQALRLDERNEVASSFIEKLRPQFSLHGIKISMPDLMGEVEGSAKPDDDMGRVHSGSGGSGGVRGLANIASEPEDEELEPSWALSGSDNDHDHTGGASPTRATFEETFALDSLRQNLHEKLLSEGLVQLSFGDHDSTVAEVDDEVPDPSSSRNKPSQRSTRRTGPPYRDESSTSDPSHTAAVMIRPALRDHKRLPTTRSPRKDKPVSPRKHSAPPHALNISTRRRSFADINRDASPELVDDTVYIDEESTDYGDGSPDVPGSPFPNSTRQFMRSPTRSASRESNLASPLSAGPFSAEEASDSEMNVNAEWAQ